MLTFNSTREENSAKDGRDECLGRSHSTAPQGDAAVATRIRESRSDKAEGARRSRIDFSYLSKIENGHLVPSVAALVAITEELGDNPDELLALAEKAPSDLGQKLRDSPNARLFYRWPST